MNDSEAVRLVEWDARYAEASVAMWRASKARALGIEEAHSFDDHVYFLTEILALSDEIWLALAGERVVGLLATDGEFVNQLYIHVDYQRLGIGSRLLGLAKARSAGRLQLRSFEVNVVARRFYEAHGFEIVGCGDDNEEGLPDILYRWQRADPGDENER